MPQQTPDGRYDPEVLIELALLAALAMVANSATNVIQASAQADSQRFMDLVRHSSNSAIEELAVTVKAANSVLNDTPSGNGGSESKQLKKIYRLLKTCLRAPGAPVVT